MRFTRFLLATVIVVCCAVSLAHADPQDLIDDGWTLAIGGIATGELPDTVSAVTYDWGSDTVIEGNGAMYLGEQARAWYRFADTPVYGEISFLVYDKGLSAIPAHSTYAGRWGVQNNPAPNPIPATGSPNDQLMAVELSWKSYIGGNVTYSFINGNTSDVSSASSHFSQTWPGGYEGESNGDHGYRRVAGATLANPVIADIGVDDTPVHVQGAWARWTLSVHDGEDMLFKVTDADGVTNQQSWTVIPVLDSIFDTGFSTTGFNQVYFYGGNPNGNAGADAYGLWIDDIIFTPDAGQGATAWEYDFNGGVDLCAIRKSEGDFNCDTEIGLLDLDILGQTWGFTDIFPNCPAGDASGDCEVGLLDLDILGQNWGLGTSVPEPATLGLLAIGGILAIRRR